MSEGAQALLWLRGGARPHPQGLAFAAQALGAFGLHNGQYIQDKCADRGTKECVNVARRVLPQIQNGLWESRRQYADFPDLRSFVNTYCKGIDPVKYFNEFKWYSYRALLFPQLGLVDPAPEFKHLERVELVRKRAFPLMMQGLSPQEEKGGIPSLDDEWAVTELYFNGGAIAWGDAEVRFEDLIALWGSAPDHEQAFRGFLAKLTTHEWAAESLISVCRRQGGGAPCPLLRLLELEVEPKEEEWRAFLVKETQGRYSYADLAWVKAFLLFRETRLVEDFIAQCSVTAVEKNLRIAFSPLLREHFLHLFRANEEIRSDICYFTSRMSVIYDMDFARLKRPSTPLLISLQIFFFMVQTYGVKEENRDALLQMLIHKEEKRGEHLAGFAQRSWAEHTGSKENATVTAAFLTMEAILESITRKRVAFSSQVPEGRELFQDPYCWPLFAIVWQSGKMGPYAQLFFRWSVDPGTLLTLKEAYELCLEVKDRLTEDNTRILIDQISRKQQYHMLPPP
jgi:hypothetical protein